VCFALLCFTVVVFRVADSLYSHLQLREGRGAVDMFRSSCFMSREYLSCTFSKGICSIRK
jgi:hypothetical protein